MPTLSVALILLMTGYGFGQAGVLGALTGVVAGVAIVSGLVIARGRQDAALAEQPGIRGSQRIGGAVAAAAAAAASVPLGWRWGWLGAIGGYVAGMLLAPAIVFIVGSIRGTRIAAASRQGLPVVTDGTPPLVELDEFAARTAGGRENQMNTRIYEGAPYWCACGEKHVFAEDEVRVLRELAGMRLVLLCPSSDALTCVKVNGAISFSGFESLFGTVSAE